jgi:8-oxo-dGTP pyrophosphatase MutT (NUDIX family)
MPISLEEVLARLRPHLLPPGPWPPGPSGERQAAVLVPFVAAVGEPALLFIRRAEGMEVHSGQVAFPGGNRDARDDGPVATALREAQEEVGLTRTQVEVLGLLGEVRAYTSGFRITGVVSLLAAGAVPRPDGREVAEAFTVPVRALADPAVYREEARTANGITRRVPYFHVEPHMVWGVTGRIVRQLLDHLAP